MTNEIEHSGVVALGDGREAMIRDLEKGVMVKDLDDGSNGWEYDTDSTNKLMMLAAVYMRNMWEYQSVTLASHGATEAEIALSARPAQEPVAWRHKHREHDNQWRYSATEQSLSSQMWLQEPLYAAPQPVINPTHSQGAGTPGLLTDPAPSVSLRVTGFRGNPLRVVLSSGDEATIGQKLINNFASPSPFGQHPDDAAVDRFAAAMKEKLAEKRADGAGGWDDPEQCHIDYLVSLLMQQIHERAVLDLVEIANLSMMIHQRGETPDYGR